MKNSDVYIIAEVGSNWAKYEDPDENLKTALKQIEKAAACGSNAVKFQLFTCAELYGDRVRGTQFEHDFNRYSLPCNWVETLADHSVKHDIDFMCSAFSVKGFEFVDPFVNRHKLASPEITDKNIVEWLNNQPKPYFYSDGCVNQVDIGRYQDVRMACVSRYPAQVSDYELSSAMGSNWGVSDHTKGSELALSAVKLGCRYIEKHVDFLFNEGKPTPDSVVSIPELSFAAWVRSIRKMSVEHTARTKTECGDLYVRRRNKSGHWFRPLPDGVSLERRGKF